MTNFTILINRGKKRFIDKYLKIRKFGKCEGCGHPTLLIEYKDEKDSNSSLKLCEYCYTTIINSEGVK